MKTNYSEVTNVYAIKMKIFESDNAENGYILALHGFCGDMESSVIKQLAKRMTAYGFVVVAFNFPGHGSSDADEFFSLHNCRRDMFEVMRYASEKYGVAAPAAIFATSFGGYVTLLNIDQIPLSTTIILRAPAVNMCRSFESFIEDIDAFRKCGWQEMGFDRKLKVTYSFYEELERSYILESDLEREMLIIHGDSDSVVLQEEMQLFCKHNPEAILEVIKGADHRFKGNGQLKNIIDLTEKYILEV